MLLLNCCTSTAIKKNEELHLFWPSVPGVYDENGNPLIFQDKEKHIVYMDENKWFEIVSYIVGTEENKKALAVYFDY